MVPSRTMIVNPLLEHVQPFFILESSRLEFYRSFLLGQGSTYKIGLESLPVHRLFFASAGLELMFHSERERSVVEDKQPSTKRIFVSLIFYCHNRDRPKYIRRCCPLILSTSQNYESSVTTSRRSFIDGSQRYRNRCPSSDVCSCMDYIPSHPEEYYFAGDTGCSTTKKCDLSSSRRCQCLRCWTTAGNQRWLESRWTHSTCSSQRYRICSLFSCSADLHVLQCQFNSDQQSPLLCSSAGLWHSLPCRSLCTHGWLSVSKYVCSNSWFPYYGVRPLHSQHWPRLLHDQRIAQLIVILSNKKGRQNWLLFIKTNNHLHKFILLVGLIINR